ncbi:lysophospholipase L1-like esterase [Duganella sp. 1224]|uniref:GDSL-type esterase/lipase family protein n=1 Tax=Duganella sp. 1224 TaxID=2587052 RepID=UPI0015C8787E|nr:GDSL-type esterase/lipase family protein [Duganella sp. 1224]NYE63101.1 lysophospholipase L1-like esterase [Duganella sp. 1224]
MHASLQNLGRVLLAAPLIAAAMVAMPSRAADAVPWTGTWSVTPWTTDDAGFRNQTIRQIVHTSIGGTAARIRLSNRFGTQPVTLGPVYIALRASEAATVPGSGRQVLFNGRSTVTIPAGAEVSSDTVAFAVPALSDIAVSLYVPGATAPRATGHGGSLQDVYIAPGNAAADTNMRSVSTNSASGQAYYFLTNVDVQNAAATGAVVAFGASITDGVASRPNVNLRWTNDLALRLQQAGMTVGVLNQGISGNNFFSDGAGQAGRTRFAHDVLQQPGVKWVIVSDDAVNNLNNANPVPAADLIAVLKELIAAAHQSNVKFLCSTLTPFHGTPQWTQAAEESRAQLNAFMKSANSGCDAVVDQALATSDPADRSRYLAQYDAGDSLHPNEAGLQAIADAVPLTALGQPSSLPPVAAPTQCGQLLPGQGLKRGQQLQSCDGRFGLNLQNDGNLVIYLGATPLWNTATQGSSAALLLMRDDGNLVEYDAAGGILWQSGVHVSASVATYLQNDGNFVTYSAGKPVWYTGTCCH